MTVPVHTTEPVCVTEHLVRRLDVAVPLPYDRAVSRYEELVPAVDLARFGLLATWDAALELAEINAPHGFMIYWRSDVTATMAGSPSDWKCVEYLMGNHTIAERMFRHDPTVMLYAPLRTVIYANTEGDTRFAIDQPSTLFDSYGNPAIAEVGRHLDRLVANLLTRLGAPVPEELAS
ncbi:MULTISPECIES: DUF302 domain-containing protein [unclassified Pseudofrankia]|uniref:DUF302 domain-containing protein n=1 Tax=unclassified Pseudofrankia TaxID=2994372 RepID=UPI0008DAA14E|nr:MULTISPECIES: DUF302 domain-containing protein [unclassified Pseudofrankia]MDT3440228.1 DUF302 domain-containing protein [Pseudofrankia sp. BMG5.37]OHV42637.1 hypothetical protein BCD48_30375 [Pseudofrankia sp. BMG5.36]